MSKKISVLILVDEYEYVQRCIASIKNQTYSEIDIWKITDTTSRFTLESDDFSKVSKDSFAKIFEMFLHNSDSQSVLFVRSSQILAQDCIQNLVLSGKDICSATILHNLSKNLFPCREDKLFLSGKFFSIEALESIKLKIDDLFVEDQILFAMEVLSQNYDYVIVDAAYIYTLEQPAEISLSPEFLLSIISEYSDGLLKLSPQYLLDYCDLAGLTDLDKIQFVINMYPYIKDNISAVMFASYNYIAPVVQKDRLVLIGEQEFSLLKKLFILINENEKKMMIYIVLGCPEFIGLLITVLDYVGFQGYLPFLEKQFRQENSSKENVIRSLDATEKRIIKQVKQIQTTIANLTISDTTEKSIDDIFGLELVDYTVNCYQTGKLGFRTLLKSFKAWIKYKL